MKKNIKKIVATGCVQIGLLGLPSLTPAENYYIPWLDNTTTWSAVALSNDDTEDKNVTVTVFDTTGTVVNTENVTIPANGQRHFVVAQGYAGQGSIEIESPDGALANIALEGHKAKKVMVSVGTTEGFCHNLINHFTVTDLWESDLRLSNPTNQTVSYTMEFIDLDGASYATFAGNLSPRASESIDLRTKLEQRLGSVVTAKGKIKVVSDNPLVAVLTYNDFKTGKINIASVKATCFASDYTLGNSVIAVNSQTEPTVFYVKPGDSASWVEFPSTFTVYDSNGNEKSLTGNRLNLSVIGKGERIGYSVKNHADHTTRLVFIGDTPPVISSPKNNTTYATTTGSSLFLNISISETDMFQSISKIELYKGKVLVNSYTSVPKSIILSNVASGTATYKLTVTSAIGKLEIDSAVISFNVRGDEPDDGGSGGGDGSF